MQTLPSYAACERLINTSRNNEYKKMAHNTVLEKLTTGVVNPDIDKITYALRLHQTHVLKFFPNGTVQLDSGGWLTATTKDRLNYGPWGIYQRGGGWLVCLMDGDGHYDAENPVEYTDGMLLRINRDGSSERVHP